MKVYIKKQRIVEEESDTEKTQQKQQDTQSDSQKPSTNNKEYNDALLKYNGILTKYNELVKTFNAQKETLRNQIIAINGTRFSFPLIGESYVFDNSYIEDRYKKKLFEAKTNASQVEELMYLFKIAIDRLGDKATRTASVKELHTYARNVKTFITNKEWNKEINPKNHWDELSEFIRAKLGGEKLKLRDSELDAIMDNLKDLFKKSSTFSWIFGKEEN